jgi:lipopolysaccharide/colanic/teichoic acid biosynthesis glycosyltransferase
MSSERIHFSILAADLLWIVLALLSSFLLRYHGNLHLGSSSSVHSSFLLLAGVSLAIWFLVYQVMDLDCFRHGWQISAMFSRTSLGVFFYFAVILSWGYFARLYYSRLALLCYFALLWVGITLIRLGVYGLLLAQTRAGKARKAVLIGDYGLSREMTYRIGRHPELLYNIVGFLTPFGHAEILNGNSSGHLLSGLTSLDAIDFLRKMGVQELIVLVKHAPGLEMQNFLARCQEGGMRIHVLPQPYELYVSRPQLMEIDGIPLLTLEKPHSSVFALAVKRAFDLIVASLLILPTTVILTAAAGMLWLKERRSLRKENRCGRNGQEFAMYRLDIETDEDKASPLHKMLHRMSISELPQILNVFRGEMSLVGPRPEPPERVRDYSEWQKQRLKILPGMTGLAQVNGMREHNSSEEKTRHDLQYVLHWTPFLDVVLLVQTVWTLAGRLINQRPLNGSTLHPYPTQGMQECTRRAGESSWD